MTTPPHILLVDDDERLRRAAGKVLAAEGYRVTSAGFGRRSAGMLEASQPWRWSSATCGCRTWTALRCLKQARELLPEAEVVMITGHGSVEKAVEAMRLGAYDFIQKPLDSAALLKTVAKALEKQRLTSENRQLRRQLQQRRGVDALIGDSPAMQAVKQLIRQIAPTDVNVLIQGESGTGKEIVADALHDLSDRRDRPFVKISCAAIPETLLESELFGHERGAFTGAAAARPGKFELADGGTLLLDEIAEMTPQLQAKLLRVLQDGSFQRLGGTKEIHVNVRLLCATHADIPKAIAAEKFRHDLYYRINTVQIVLPPLRERREDIPLLAGHFLRTVCRGDGQGRPRHRTARARSIAGPRLARQRAGTEPRHSTRRGAGRRATRSAILPSRQRPAALRTAATPDGSAAFPFPSARPWTKPRNGWCRRRSSNAPATNSRPRGCSAFRRAPCIGISQTRNNKVGSLPKWQRQALPFWHDKTVRNTRRSLVFLQNTCQISLVRSILSRWHDFCDEE